MVAQKLQLFPHEVITDSAITSSDGPPDRVCCSRRAWLTVGRCMGLLCVWWSRRSTFEYAKLPSVNCVCLTTRQSGTVHSLSTRKSSRQALDRKRLIRYRLAHWDGFQFFSDENTSRGNLVRILVLFTIHIRTPINLHSSSRCSLAVKEIITSITLSPRTSVQGPHYLTGTHQSGLSSYSTA
jgi:hypothetical protein